MKTASNTINFDGEIWKGLPNYPGIYVTESGRVARHHKGCTIERIYQTSNRLYGVDENGNESRYILVTLPGRKGGRSRTTVGVHRLVCATWVGPPPCLNKRYEVNHKDGNKANNHASNLEWVTGSENVEHCFDMGQHKTANRVIATNAETGEEKIFRSISQLASFYGMERAYAVLFVKKHTSEPKDGWVFKFEEKVGRKEYKHHHNRQIAFKDYETGVITFCESIQHSAQLSGVSPGTIASAARYNRKNGVRLTGKFIFQDLVPEMQWPEYTKEQIEKSVQEMNRRSKLTESRRHKF